MRAAALLVVALSCAATSARAQVPRLPTCVAGVLAELTAHGARPGGAAWTGFLLENETASFSVDAGMDTGCIGLLAVGETKVRDVDLFLHTAGGTEVAHDTGDDAHPYVRFCGAPGARLFGTVRVYAGRGEVLVTRIDHAPATLDELDARLGACSAASSGVHTTRPDLGPAAPEPSAEDALARAVAPLEQLGFVRDAAPATVRLGERHEPLAVARGCHAIAIVPSADLVVGAEVRDHGGRTLAETTARATPAVLETCVETEARLWLRSDEEGRAIVVSLRPPPGLPPEPAGLAGGARVRWAEAAAHLARRGLAPAPLAWTHVAPGDAITVPVALRAGACVGLIALADDDVIGDDLDLVLAGADGRKIAWDVGSGGTPVVTTCADRDETARLSLRHYGATPGEILLVIGASP